MKLLKRILLGSALLFSLNLLAKDVVAQEMEPTLWQDLLPQVETVEDPFAALDPNQLYDLGTIARYRDAQKVEGFTPSKESQQEIEALKANFAKSNIDVDELFVQRETIMQQRTKLATLPNTELLNKAHRIPGFITPVEMEGTKVTKFFLVPTAGACIHTPPPPPNQIVLVEYPEGIELVSLQTPVWVEGELFNEAAKANVNYSDGASNVETVYQMSAQEVELYQTN
ncbi:hypothetical protein BCT04_02200 [Vibrio breoganii]|uniref:DUF3299 domain-containing protein n=2 Tax=Vibrio TaxID=662 RepID=A0AAN0XUF1_9VIBR|nr:DUF3299 domain-containing protein [Vibrio breoganii]ANO32845.1 hypothetical protein A6E01_06370 [Vibrio breoganii]OCH73374.1 hypothetical protein A6D95_16270 [Vibrio breoganii]OED93893.1 hypothetical protein A1QG_03820 [Vibrio breoganii ZF-29]OEF81743.1 hypothetical protein B003_02325 [Vibrio breoganii 1C10]PMG36383.1 hypothetical protein BCU93_02190 [Vibrio breoganii]